MNAFTDEKSQAMRNDGVRWRGAREKHHVFFSILLATLTDNNDVIMDWQCGVGILVPWRIALLRSYNLQNQNDKLRAWITFPITLLTLLCF